MRSVLKTFLLLFLPAFAIAQDSTITISPAMVSSHYIPLGNLNGWLFKQGNDIEWAQKEINLSSWTKLKPSELSGKLADQNGRLEGWLRLKIKLDTAFRNTAIEMYMEVWAASEVYADGNLVNTFGNTGINGKPFAEYRPLFQLPVPLNLQKGIEHIIAFHFVDFRSPFPPYHLKSAGNLTKFVAITTPEFKTNLHTEYLHFRFYTTMWVSVNVILCLLFWLLALQNRAEKNLMFIAITSTVLTFLIYCEAYSAPGTSYFANEFVDLILPLLRSGSMILGIIVMLRVFDRKITLFVRIVAGGLLVLGIAQLFSDNNILVTFQASLILLVYAYYITTSWKTLKGAQWALLVGILCSVIFGLFLSISLFLNPGAGYSLGAILRSGLYLSYPLSLAVYVSLRFREIIREVQNNAQKIVQLSEEKKEQALNQQKILQEEVNRQTTEIRTALENLKSTQSQLIQSEKMASLGELTAGIAHEIQNPLNFVNNFSDVNKELFEEMESEIQKGNLEEAKRISNDIKQNLDKINQHGQRADAIVKSMLQHSRKTTGEKESTDINKLADEYLRLAYHGFRAKDKDFNAELITNFDKEAGNLKIIPQDIGRVILNLLNNAFYTVGERYKANGLGYEPTVSLTTKKIGDKVELRVADNGSGIPRKVVDKIFQPFFTTKPTGQGTGLGLSLSYDIVKAHGGEITVQTEEGKGTEMIIQLPIT